MFESETTASKRLIEHGSAIKTGTAMNGREMPTVEVPIATEIRSLVEAVQAVYPKRYSLPSESMSA
ncbi:bacterio-opsin activator domain-containing protein [Haladaptatus halobius]|uniref:bacterio-opsin activator domain-containing protein n=1 Tax=Haladaptatus halobius TaxID=2884875 RepID=UPI001D0B9003